jgi:hypothetical protein
MIIHTRIPKSTRKRKSKSASIVAAEAALQATLKRCGYVCTKQRSKLPAPSTDITHRDYSQDSIPANGAAKPTNRYTGTEIAGIATLHKSCAQPIRRDNPTADAKSAQMRR